jgi:hypothetical protein
MADFYGYLHALFVHWLWLMSAGPFLADRLISWLWPYGRKRLDGFVGEKRRRISLWFMINWRLYCGVFGLAR